RPEKSICGQIAQGKSAVEMLDGLVAFAGCQFQFLAVDDFDRPAQVFDESRLLQNAGRQAHARPSGAQHLREKLVGDGKKFRVHAVLTHEQPARQPLFDLVQPVAGGNLGNLKALHQHVTIQQQLQLRRFVQDFFQHLGPYAHSSAGNLHDAAIGTAMQPYGQGRAYNTLVSDNCYLHAAAVAGKYDQRCQTLVEEVGELDFVPGFVQDVVMGEFDIFEVVLDQLVFTFRDRAEDFIPDRFATALGPHP